MKEWFWNPRDLRRSLLLMPKPEKTSRVEQFLWPVSIDYFSTLNPIFLHQVAHIDLFSSAPVWLIRDGLIPILWFFNLNKHPPKNWKSRLVVHSSVAHFVPKSWRDFVGTYRIRSTNPLEPRNRGTIIFGLITDAYCSLEFLEEKLKSIAPGLRKSESPVQVYLVEKFDSTIDYKKENYHMEYVLKIYQHLGAKVNTLTWARFLSLDSFQDSRLIDLNDHMIVADSFLLHHALSRGGVLEDLKEENKESPGPQELFRISPFHSIEVSPKINSEKMASQQWKSLEDFLLFEKRVLKSVNTDVRYLFPWPRSLLSWARATQIVPETIN